MEFSSYGDLLNVIQLVGATATPNEDGTWTIPASTLETVISQNIPVLSNIDFVPCTVEINP